MIDETGFWSSSSSSSMIDETERFWSRKQKEFEDDDDEDEDEDESDRRP
jgi:hypothetical protein